MSKFLTVYDDVAHTLEALNPKNATAIGIPAFSIGNSLPAAGQIIGEGFLVSPTKTGYLWDGARWVPIVPSALLMYATDALVYADKAQPDGSYAVSAATGNLFTSYGTGKWRQVGVRTYATEAVLLADTTSPDGDVAYAKDTALHFARVGTAWKPMSITQFATEAVMNAKTTGNLVGQIAVTTAENRVYVWSGAAWIGQPFTHVATEAALLASTPPDGTLAVADDTSKAFFRSGGAWHKLGGGVTFTSAATAPTTPVVGDIWMHATTKAVQIYDGAAWKPVGGGVQVFTNGSSFPAAASRKAGDIYYAKDTGKLTVVETDGQSSLKEVTIGVPYKKGTVTGSATAAADSTFFLVKGISSINGVTRVEIRDNTITGAVYEFDIAVSNGAPTTLTPFIVRSHNTDLKEIRVGWGSTAGIFVLGVYKNTMTSAKTYTVTVSSTDYDLYNSVSFGNGTDTTTEATTASLSCIEDFPHPALTSGNNTVSAVQSDGNCLFTFPETRKPKRYVRLSGWIWPVGGNGVLVPAFKNGAAFFDTTQVSAIPEAYNQVSWGDGKTNVNGNDFVTNHGCAWTFKATGNHDVKQETVCFFVMEMFIIANTVRATWRGNYRAPDGSGILSFHGGGTFNFSPTLDLTEVGVKCRQFTDLAAARQAWFDLECEWR